MILHRNIAFLTVRGIDREDPERFYGTPLEQKDWSFVTKQIGMFCFTGLTAEARVCTPYYSSVNALPCLKPVSYE